MSVKINLVFKKFYLKVEKTKKKGKNFLNVLK